MRAAAGAACSHDPIRRVGLAPRPVQRQKKLAAQPLPQRMLPHGVLKLRDQLGVLSKGQPSVDLVLERRQTPDPAMR
jgi:hypothetical protein